MPSPIFAHLGHWYISLPVFMGPALLLVIALKVQTWRERDEGRQPHKSSKRSSVTVTQEGAKTIVAVSGPLDYPALLDIEVELGRTGRSTPELVLDLRHVTSAEEESAWSLCDVLGQGHVGGQVSALVSPESGMHPGSGLQALKTVFAAEGVGVIEGIAADRSL